MEDRRAWRDDIIRQVEADPNSLYAVLNRLGVTMERFKYWQKDLKKRKEKTKCYESKT